MILALLRDKGVRKTEVIIRGSPKEIAALVLAVQERQGEESEKRHVTVWKNGRVKIEKR